MVRSIFRERSVPFGKMRPRSPVPGKKLYYYFFLPGKLHANWFRILGRGYIRPAIFRGRINHERTRNHPTRGIAVPKIDEKKNKRKMAKQKGSKGKCSIRYVAVERKRI